MNAHRPVIPGFYPDPSICRVRDTYYLVNSSFEYAPGVPIHRSTDLRTWEQIGNVLDRPSQLAVAPADPSGGVFAPTLRHHGGRFWMVTTNWSDGGGQLLVHAEDPAGPWSDPIRIPGALGIDPDLAWDDDGTCLMTYAGFGPGGSEGIVQSAIDPLTGEVLEERRRLWNGTGGKFPEGPHLYRIGEWWYLLIAEGGTERGHAVTIARSRTPRGPFEAGPHNPLLTHRGTDRPVQNTGHADLVERPDGTWAIVYHGVRPRGSSPEWHVLGRETFADEISWTGGWPVPAGHLQPPVDEDRAVTEIWGGGTLPVGWMAASRFPSEISGPVHGGWQVIESDGAPVFLGRRQQHLYARVTARLDVEGRGGLSIRIDPRHALDVEREGNIVRAVWSVGDVRCVLAERPVGDDEHLEIRLVPSDGHWTSTARGPDVVLAGVSGPDSFTELGRVDGRYLSTEVAGGMTGRMVGVAVTDGRVRVRSFTYTGSDLPLPDPTPGPRRVEKPAPIWSPA